MIKSGPGVEGKTVNNEAGGGLGLNAHIARLDARDSLCV